MGLEDSRVMLEDMAVCMLYNIRLSLADGQLAGLAFGSCNYESDLGEIKSAQRSDI